MSPVHLTTRYVLLSLAGLYLSMYPTSLLAGTYLLSAHGSSSDGVLRPSIGPPPSGFGYSQGNCAHCHEQHASINGSEPAPSSGSASPYELFATNFNSAAQTNPYAEADNFCFFCHNDPATAQSVLNNDNAQTFGCGAQGPTTIRAAMNQLSYHNLYDVWNFSKATFPGFTSSSNPCNACHNPHLARQNRLFPQDPTYSAISKPSDHFNLWGTTETMDSSYNTQYEPPYCSNALSDREPAASVDASNGRANTPDYVAFCTSCHTTTNTIASSTLARDLKTIDWSNTGDKHGLRPMDGSVSTMPPFDTPSSGTDFVLSCLDCHEAHGSENVMLLRRRANGSDLSAAITSLDTSDWGLLCLKCHKDDAAAGIGNPNDWEYIHHKVSDAPYTQKRCGSCHPGGPGRPIACQSCHYHGGVATKADKNGVYRIAF